MAVVPMASHAPAATTISVRQFLDSTLPRPVAGSPPPTPSSASQSSAAGSSTFRAACPAALRAGVTSARVGVGPQDFEQELFRELRTLREGVALAANCNRILQSKMEDYGVDLEGLGYAGTKDRCRQVEMRLFLRQALQVGNAERNAFFSLHAWALLVRRRRHALPLLIASPEQRMLLHVLHTWRRDVFDCHLNRRAAQLEMELESAKAAQGAQLAGFQDAQTKLTESRLASIEGFFKVPPEKLLRMCFRPWSTYVVELKNRADVSASMGKKKMFLMEASRRSVVLHTWRKHASGERIKQQSRLAMLKRIEKAFASRAAESLTCVFKAWMQSCKSELLLASAQRENSIACADRASKLAEAKESSKSIRDDCRAKVLAAIGSSTGLGLLSEVVREWASLSSIAAIEEKVERGHLLLAALQRSRARCRGAFGRIVALRCSRAARNAQLLWCLVAWRRILAGGYDACPRRSGPEQDSRGAWQRQRLDLQLSTEPRLLQQINEFSKSTLKIRQSWACQMLWSRLEKTTSAIQLGALQRWRISNARAGTAVFTNRERRHRAHAEETSRQIDAMRARMRRQRYASLVAFGHMSETYLGDLCHVLFCAWVVDACFSKQDSSHHAKIKDLEAQRTKLKLQRSADDAQRLKKSMAVMRSCSDQMLLAVMVQGWSMLMKDAKAEAEMAALEAECEAKKAEISAGMSQKKKAGLQMALVGGSANDTEVGMRTILQNWRTVAKNAVLKEKRRIRQEQHFGDADAMCSQLKAYKDILLIGRAFIACKVFLSDARLIRDSNDLDTFRRNRRQTYRRLRVFVELSSGFTVGNDTLRCLCDVFGAWRSHAGVTIVQRTCDQVCTAMDERTAYGREALEAVKAKAEIVGSRLLQRQAIMNSAGVAARLLLPAWRHHALAARRRRDAWARTEAGTAHAEAVRSQASQRSAVWRTWLATQQLKDKDHHAVVEIFNSWFRCMRSVRLSRAHVLAGAAVASQQICTYTRAQLRRHCFRTWVRWRSEEFMNRLEREILEMEKRVPVYARLPSPVVSSSSSEADYDWEDEEPESPHSASSEHFGFYTGGQEAASSPTAAARAARRASMRRLAAAFSSSSSSSSPRSPEAPASLEAPAELRDITVDVRLQAPLDEADFDKRLSSFTFGLA